MQMAHSTTEESVQHGQEIYEREIRPYTDLAAV